MSTRRLWLLAALPLALFACDTAEEEPLEEPATVVADVEPVATPATPAGATAGATTVNLQPVNNSGVTGEATLSEAAAGTQVMVRLMNAPAGEHAGHIHEGTCASLGSVVAPLQPITAGADGTGMMTTTVDQPLSTVTNGQHLIAYHEAGGNPGAVITCGEIPATTM